MPAKSERVKVEVKETSTPDLRSFNITLTAPTRDFQLTDLLRQRGIIDSLDAELKQAIKRATEDYLKSAEVLVSGLASKSSDKRKSRSNSNDDHKSAQLVSCAQREL